MTGVYLTTLVVNNRTKHCNVPEDFFSGFIMSYKLNNNTEAQAISKSTVLNQYSN